MSQVKSYAAFNTIEDLKPFDFERRPLGAKDVHIDIHYCGVCHSDLHMVQNDWGRSQYPLVPGHEIIGRVKAIGDKVSGFKLGDLVGVGCMVDSCHQCSACEAHQEQFCEQGMVATYGSPDPIMGGVTQGGYSTEIVVSSDFVLHVAESLDTTSVAPLLCAGITLYSPLKKWNVQPGDRVGIIGLGGLGHMGIKLAAAMGAEVTIITTSADKANDAKRLGAKHVILSKDENQMAAAANHFDLLIDTISVEHDVNPYLALLKRNKTMVVLGATPVELHSMSVIFGGKHLSGSLIGGIKETQEMLDFCAKHNIVSDVELIPIQNINVAYARLRKSEVKYRFVIDLASLKT